VCQISEHKKRVGVALLQRRGTRYVAGRLCHLMSGWPNNFHFCRAFSFSENRIKTQPLKWKGNLMNMLRLD